MPFCPECGKPYPDQATKCSSCGKELPAAATKPAGGKFKGTMLMTPAVAEKLAAGKGSLPQTPAGAPAQPAPTPAPMQQPAEPAAGAQKAPADQMAFQATMLMGTTPLPGALQPPDKAQVVQAAGAAFKAKGTILAAVAPPAALKPSGPVQTPQPAAPAAQPAPPAAVQPAPEAAQPVAQAVSPAPMQAGGGESFSLRRPIAEESSLKAADARRFWIGVTLGFFGILAIFAAIALLLLR